MYTGFICIYRVMYRVYICVYVYIHIYIGLCMYMYKCMYMHTYTCVYCMYSAGGWAAGALGSLAGRAAPCCTKPQGRGQSAGRAKPPAHNPAGAWLLQAAYNRERVDWRHAEYSLKQDKAKVGQAQVVEGRRSRVSCWTCQVAAVALTRLCSCLCGARRSARRSGRPRRRRGGSGWTGCGRPWPHRWAALTQPAHALLHFPTTTSNNTATGRRPHLFAHGSSPAEQHACGRHAAVLAAGGGGPRAPAGAHRGVRGRHGQGRGRLPAAARLHHRPGGVGPALQGARRRAARSPQPCDPCSCLGAADAMCTCASSCLSVVTARRCRCRWRRVQVREALAALGLAATDYGRAAVMAARPAQAPRPDAFSSDQRAALMAARQS